MEQVQNLIDQGVPADKIPFSVICDAVKQLPRIDQKLFNMVNTVIRQPDLWEPLKEVLVECHDDNYENVDVIKRPMDIIRIAMNYNVGTLKMVDLYAALVSDKVFFHPVSNPLDIGKFDLEMIADEIIDAAETENEKILEHALKIYERFVDALDLRVECKDLRNQNRHDFVTIKIALEKIDIPMLLHNSEKLTCFSLRFWKK